MNHMHKRIREAAINMVMVETNGGQDVPQHVPPTKWQAINAGMLFAILRNYS